MNYKNEKLDLLLLLATTGVAESATAAGHDFLALCFYILVSLFGFHKAVIYVFQRLDRHFKRKFDDVD